MKLKMMVTRNRAKKAIAVLAIHFLRIIELSSSQVGVNGLIIGRLVAKRDITSPMVKFSTSKYATGSPLKCASLSRLEWALAVVKALDSDEIS
jgi:hypothetical protein